MLMRPGRDGPEVLLVRRGRPPAEGQWSFPGGTQRLGETAEAAARRELLEETGLSVGALRLAAHVDSVHRDEAGRVRFHYTILDFCGLWTGGEARAGGDAAGLMWAGAQDFEAIGLWSEARQVAGVAARVLFDGSFL